MPEPVKTMVTNGHVSATMAMQTVKSVGTDAEQKLKAGLEAAKADGKNKIKPSHLDLTNAKKQLKTMIVDFLDSSDIDDEQEDMVIIKCPADKWDELKQLLKY